MNCTLALVLTIWSVGADVPVSPEEKAIRQVLDDQVVAWNKGDLEGFMKGYWNSDQLTFFSGKEKTSGWKATLERYQKKYKSDGKAMGKLTFSDVEVTILSADSAVVKGRWALDYGAEKDKPSGLYTLIWKKHPEGWRIVHDHTSGS